MFGDLTNQYLEKLFDDLQREHQRLLTDLKHLNADSMSKEGEIQKQISLVNVLMTNTLKYKNLKSKIALKAGSA